MYHKPQKPITVIRCNYPEYLYRYKYQLQKRSRYLQTGYVTVEIIGIIKSFQYLITPPWIRHGHRPN